MCSFSAEQIRAMAGSVPAFQHMAAGGWTYRRIAGVALADVRSVCRTCDVATSGDVRHAGHWPSTAVGGLETGPVGESHGARRRLPRSRLEARAAHQLEVVLGCFWVRVLDYRDAPGLQTRPHQHPNSVMITLSDIRRRLSSGGKTAEVEMTIGRAMWLGAQVHSGHNIGDTDTHVIFVELKAASFHDAAAPGERNLGPTLAT